MGNTFSSPNEPMDIKSLSSHIDDIAIHYILKQNTIDLLRLTDKEYYDNLIVLVSNLFDRRLSDMEVGSIHQRIYPETVQTEVLNLLPTTGKVKDNMINSISKFYIKIMMIFSAIVATIDPQYSYEDNNGTQQLFYLKDIHSYKNIPKNVQPMVHQLTNPMNLCRKRISILRNKLDVSDPDFITINPGEKICSTESTNHLTDEIGIKELDLLYYDIFDTKSKTWKSRSKEMEEKYQEDLKKFYMVFTGKSEIPNNIKSFKDIELFDFQSIEYCRDNLFTHDFIISKDNQLIMRYKEQVELLEQSTSKYRIDLIGIIKRIFLTKIENEVTSYTIRPTLTLEDILQIEKDTRTTIIDLYTNCEQYFIRALLIFEELYDTQSKLVNESRVNYLENRPLYTDNLIHSNNPNWMNQPKIVPIFPEPKESESMSKNIMPFEIGTVSNKNETFTIPSKTEPVPMSQPEPSPFSQPLTQPLTQPELMPFTQPLTQPEPMPFTQPLAQPEPMPFTQPLTQPESMPFTQPELIPFTQPEPVPFTQPEPVPFTQPFTQPLTQPEPMPLPQPEPMPFTQPLTQPESMPFTQPLTQPEPVPFTQPLTQPEPVPFTQPEPMPLPQPLTQPLTQPEPTPFTPPLTQPEPMPMTQPEPMPFTLPETNKKNSLNKEPVPVPFTQPLTQPIPFTQPVTQPGPPPLTQPTPFTLPETNQKNSLNKEPVPVPFTLPETNKKISFNKPTNQASTQIKPLEKPLEDKPKEEGFIQKLSNFINNTNTNKK